MLFTSTSCEKASGGCESCYSKSESLTSKNTSSSAIESNHTLDNMVISIATDDETELSAQPENNDGYINTYDKDNLFVGSTEELVYLGDFFATAYTHTGHNTAIGVYPKANHTVGVDPNIIPYGTTIVVEIMGELRTYVAEDTGYLAENQLDIFYDTYDECIQFGVRECKVWILE